MSAQITKIVTHQAFLKTLASASALFLPSSSNTFENDPTTVWIYEKMDMFVLFRKGKLIAHFEWSEFKERSMRPMAEIDSKGTMPPSLIATALSMSA